MNMKVAPEILSLVPYAPGKPISETKREFGLQNVVKLASNECPFPPSPKVLKALQEALLEIHRYPDAAAFEMKQAAAKYYGVDESWISFGNGSNELIDLLIRIYCEPGDQILTSQGAFIAYKISAQAARVQTVETALKPDYGFDIKAMIDALKTNPKIRLIFLANPNNPTGTYVRKNDFDELLHAIKGREDVLLILDEAYTEFVRAKDYPDGKAALLHYPNVCLLRTMSKVFGLAGLRVGFLLARPEVTGLIHRVRDPFNVNSLAQVAAVAVMQDQEFIDKVKHVTWAGVDFFMEQFKQMGLDFVPSQGNFIFFDTKMDSTEVFNQLLRTGIIVRPMKNYGFMTQIRLSVGLNEENVAAISALKTVLGAKK
jgi:histidinol-phosphate aminotransferase